MYSKNDNSLKEYLIDSNKIYIQMKSIIVQSNKNNFDFDNITRFLILLNSFKKKIIYLGLDVLLNLINEIENRIKIVKQDLKVNFVTKDNKNKLYKNFLLLSQIYNSHYIKYSNLQEKDLIKNKNDLSFAKINLEIDNKDINNIYINDNIYIVNIFLNIEDHDIIKKIFSKIEKSIIVLKFKLNEDSMSFLIKTKNIHSFKRAIIKFKKEIIFKIFIVNLKNDYVKDIKLDYLIESKINKIKNLVQENKNDFINQELDNFIYEYNNVKRNDFDDFINSLKDYINTFDKKSLLFLNIKLDFLKNYVLNLVKNIIFNYIKILFYFKKNKKNNDFLSIELDLFKDDDWLFFTIKSKNKVFSGKMNEIFYNIENKIKDNFGKSILIKTIHTTVFKCKLPLNIIDDKFFITNVKNNNYALYYKDFKEIIRLKDFTIYKGLDKKLYIYYKNSMFYLVDINKDYIYDLLELKKYISDEVILIEKLQKIAILSNGNFIESNLNMINKDYKYLYSCILQEKANIILI